jgi:hypothetical protein
MPMDVSMITGIELNPKKVYPELHTNTGSQCKTYTIEEQTQKYGKSDY